MDLSDAWSSGIGCTSKVYDPKFSTRDRLVCTYVKDFHLLLHLMSYDGVPIIFLSQVVSVGSCSCSIHESVFPSWAGLKL
jgi:hypothetical protein